MSVEQRKLVVILVIPALVFGEFMGDLHTPLGISDWAWFLIPLFLTIFAGGRFLPYVLAGVFSVLMVAGFFLSPPGVDPALALIGRVMGISISWLMAAFISQRHRASEGGSYAVMQRRAT